MSIFRRGFWCLGVLAALASCADEEARPDAVAEVRQAVIGDNDDDGVLDGVDLDDDNDGILDETECATPSMAASDFWVLFNPNFSAAGRRELHIAGTAGTQVTIAGAAPQAIPASGLLSVDTGLTRIPTPGVVESGKAIRVTASAPVHMFANNFQAATADAFSVVPVAQLGNSYRAIGYPNSSTTPSQVSVYATQDNTAVTIGSTSITLNAGQSYLREANDDPTGLLITANKPVAVNSGNKCLDTGTGSCDHVEQMLFPISGWDSDYFIPVSPQTQLYRVVANTNNTVVSVDGLPVATLAAGQFFTGLVGGVRVTTSQPTQVYIVALGELLAGPDPSFVLLAGAPRGVTSVTFSALATDNVNSVVVSMPTAAIASLRLDGAPVVAVWLPYLLLSGYSFTTFVVTPGVHRLTADQRFLPIIWGEKSFESYAYVPGRGFPPGTCTTDTDGDGIVNTFDPDADGDGVNDVTEANGIDLNGDGRADGITGPTGIPLTAGLGLSAPDTDGDGATNNLDPDSDNDGVNDGVDTARLIPTICRDQDSDGCDDCTVTGANGSGGSTINDGPDNDADGVCNLGDPDDDNDGSPDVVDIDDNNRFVCSDTDLDGCEDCLSGSYAPGNDGPDFDNDGQCNAGDLDDDNDGSPDVIDSDDANPNVCSDVDGDSCDDCTGGAFNPGSDGPDFDNDGQCNAGDLDDDNDGSPDAVDSDDGNPNICSDTDADTCDDCTSGIYAPGNDGPDFDLDGRCNAGDSDDDNDGSPDASDSDDANPFICSDTDGDTCEDCAFGSYNPALDGPDFDTDGQCNAGDSDDDNDGSPDAVDSNDFNRFICSDTDGDGCEDCSSGSYNPSSDGPDNDSDGQCNLADPDDDNDGSPDVVDIDDNNPNVCSDTDGDGCEDCSSGTYAPGNDGADFDSDGRCDAGDLDDDNDGSPDAVDSNDNNPNICSDTDSDGCDDCSSGTYAPGSDGADFDNDGQCNVGDSDDDNDGSPDAGDSDDNNPNVCSDTDGDTCEDCSSGTYAPGNDGPDADGDGRCDAGDFDDDNDTVPDPADNCPNLANPDQADFDGDGQGDACDVDDDNDGLDDVVEVAVGSDAFDADSDDDGLIDGDETNPGGDADGDGIKNVLDSDADNDGIFDGTEAGVAVAAAGTDLSAGRFRADADPSTTTNPFGFDSDGGGVRDGAEDRNHNGRVDPGETDPNNPVDDGQAPLDTDGDGLPDADELAIGTNPNDADSDDDGVRDGQEPNFSSDSDGDGLINALDPDSDNDGLYDGTERGVVVPPVGTDITRGHFIPDASPATTTNPIDADTDGGGVSDGDEDFNRNGRIDLLERNPNDPLDDLLPPLDADGDGLPNAVELVIGTDPTDADSDDDGLRDGFEANYGDDTDGDGAINALDPDSDGDGIFDGTERGITTASAGTDPAAGFFVPDADPSTRTSMVNADTDRGGVSDGIEDPNHNGRIELGETNPNDPSDDNPNGDRDGDNITDVEEGTVDTDGDGIPDFLDADSDDDGISDRDEAGDANLLTPAIDTDGDGVPNFRDADSDGDFIADADEAGDASAQTPPRDTDLDGTPDFIDIDSDNDTISDRDEAGDTNLLTVPADTDNDNTPDYRDLDTDGDTISDAIEAGDAVLATPPVNTDGVDQPDWRDLDSDNDGIPDNVDNCRRAVNPGQEDTDGNGVGDACQGDSDGDGVPNGDDNCPDVPNPDQRDTDGDDAGDACDGDDDGDGVPDSSDNCPMAANPGQENADGAADGGDACDGDDDNDGVPDGVDNCQRVANPMQEDADDDGMGDACDEALADDDGDSIPNIIDNCDDVANPDQMNTDGDGSGDACDLDDDNDGFLDNVTVTGGGCSAATPGGVVGSLGVGFLLAMAGVLGRRRRKKLQSGRGAGKAAVVAGAAVLLLGLGLGMRAASAQTAAERQDFPAERFQLSSSSEGIFNVESASMGARWSWDLHLWLGDANDPLNLAMVDDNGNETRLGSLVQNRFGGELGGSVVLLPFLQVSLDLPLVLAQDRDDMINGVSAMLDSISGVGLGDLRVAPKLRLMDRRRFGVDVAVRGMLTLPTADSQDYRGDDGVTFSPSLLVSGKHGPLRWGVDVGYLVRKPTQVSALKVDDEVRAHAGLAYRVIRPLELGVTGSMATAANDLFGDSSRNYSEVLGGPSFELSRQWVLFAAAGAGLQNGYGTPDWRALAGIRVGMLEGDDDPDGDKIYGNADRCPNEAEDFDGFEDRDGCPDLDNDRDGIADALDKCANEAEDMDGFQDDDGCPDGDNDGDGIADADDKCPLEPETKNGFQDDDGCPDEADTDGDGVFDPRDACVEQAEDLDGFEDGDGCPEMDNDKDGVSDDKDRCPLVAGVVENAGCPDTDRDGDGVVDRLDNCPDEKGQMKYSGCKGPQLVTITSTKIVLLDMVYFNTNRALIQKRSFKLLNNVAQVINAHGEVKKIVVEGHTDAQGDDASNLALSQARAESVVAYLIKRGVSPARLAAKGFGETQPVADNATRTGRAANRRVEFKIDEIDTLTVQPLPATLPATLP